MTGCLGMFFIYIKNLFLHQKCFSRKFFLYQKKPPQVIQNQYKSSNFVKCTLLYLCFFFFTFLSLCCFGMTCTESNKLRHKHLVHPCNSRKHLAVLASR